MNRLDNVINMRNKTYGVEIEKAKMPRERCANLCASYFGTESSVRYVGTSYDKWTFKDTKGRTWSCVRDGSSSGQYGSISCELVTPVMSYGDIQDMIDLKAIAKIMKENGARSGRGYNAGVHVHVGGKDLSAQAIKNLIRMVNKRDKLIRNACRVSVDRLRWCQHLPSDLLSNVNELKGASLTKIQLEKVWYNTLPGGYSCRDSHYHDSRYHCLNLHSLFSVSGHGTCEFRYFEFHGDIIPTDLEAWVTMCVAMVSYAQIVSGCDDKPCNNDNSKHEMSCWLKNLGLVGRQFNSIRLRLIKHLEGDSGYATARNEY